jgi:uncharacterized lipoprotein YmbA
MRWRALLAAILCGCALTSKGVPLHVRYFSPEAIEPSGASRPIEKSALALRMGCVTSSTNLRTRIVHRDSNVELQEYETLRWTEDPEVYVEQSLKRALFDDRGIRQAVSGTMPTLDVVVTAFEELRRGTRRGGRVQLRYQIHDDQFVLASGTVTSEHAAAGGSIDQIVAAIAVAMHDASAELANAVADRMPSLVP